MKAVIAYSVEHCKALDKDAEAWVSWSHVQPGRELRICRTFYERSHRDVRAMLRELVKCGYRDVVIADPLGQYGLAVFNIGHQVTETIERQRHA